MARRPSKQQRANMHETFQRCDVCHGTGYIPREDGETFDACRWCSTTGMRLFSRVVSYINMPVAEVHDGRTQVK